MTLRELGAIVKCGIEKGCGDLQVAATINPEASLKPCDVAYGDIDISGPHFTGKVFGITAIKGEFPEALSYNGEWSIVLPDGEIVATGKRSECLSEIAVKGYNVVKTDEEFEYFEVAR